MSVIPPGQNGPCIFCEIVAKNIPAALHYEDENFLIFDDIHPRSNTHVLIIPKKHFVTLEDALQEDPDLVKEMFLLAKKFAASKVIPGYKLTIHVGKLGGQEVPHLHMHFLSDTFL